MVFSHKRNRWTTACMALLLVVLTACTQQPAAQPATTAVPQQGDKEAVSTSKTKDQLVIVQTNETRDFTTIDPYQKDITLPRTLIFDTLLVRGQDGKLAPSLAESYEFKDNNWRIKVKKGITFHNGDTLNAQSVKATIDKLMSPEVPKSTFKTLLDGVTGTNIVDEYTVDIITSSPNYALINFMVDLPILSAKQLASGDEYKTQLVGTGPYVLSDWKRGEVATLKEAPNYWGKRPPFKSVVIKNVTDEATRMAELLSGNADIASDLSSTSIKRVQGQSGYQIVSEPGFRVTWQSYFFKAPFDNAKVREALYYGIDKGTLAKNMYGEFASPAVAPVTKAGSGFVEAYPLSDYNPEKAKSLLAESGVAAPISVNLDVTQRDIDTAQVLQAQLKKIGIDAKINLMEIGPLLDPKRYEQSNAGSILLFSGYDNPDRELYRILVAAFSQKSLYKTFGYQLDSQVEQWIKDYAAEPDEKKRLALSKQILDKSKQGSPVNWLMFPPNIYGLSSNIDWKPDGTGRIDIHQIKVK
ncbi:ABC transporter substrate-binding protein [Paenibacillus periandrae]|uniref:ABC transporter substrate-binding protein n=1 Tax=Paenibacillus periandrae TaxID=1761741 RepID=UPI001F099E29|nr:ABC transporter substrate-binding protein [Paenibacillus periandrae]